MPSLARRASEGKLSKTLPRFLATLTATLFLSLEARAATPPLVVAGEKPAQARLVAVDRSWQLTFAVDRPPAADAGKAPVKDPAGKDAVPPTDPRTLAAADLVFWGELSEALPRRAQLLILAEGGRLAGEITAADQDHVTVDSLLFGEVKIPRRRVELVLVRPPSDSAVRQSLVRDLLEPPVEEDQLVLENGDRLAGRWLGTADEKGEDGERQVYRVATPAGPLSIPTTRVRGVRLAPAKTPAPAAAGLRALVGFRDGSRLVVSAMELSAKGLSLDPYDPLTKSPPWKAMDGKAAGAVTFVQPLGGKVEYLSDRTPDSYKHAPFLGREYPYHRDKSAEGTPLVVKQRTYLKGLGMRSAGILVYGIEPGVKRFEAELGVDDLALSMGAGGEFAAGLGSVEFRVLVDGVEKARATLRGGQPPTSVGVDLAGAKKLTLYVGFADRGDVLDFADWLNARLIK